jgi:hypothetical protein
MSQVLSFFKTYQKNFMPKPICFRTGSALLSSDIARLYTSGQFDPFHALRTVSKPVYTRYDAYSTVLGEV